MIFCIRSSHPHIAHTFCYYAGVTLDRRGMCRAGTVVRRSLSCREEVTRRCSPGPTPPSFSRTPRRLHFTIHDVPFAVYSNDAAVLAHVARLVQRYRTEAPADAPGTRQVLIAVQGTPTVEHDRLIDVPRRSGAHKAARIATADVDEGRVIFRRETGVLTAIQPDSMDGHGRPARLSGGSDARAGCDALTRAGGAGLPDTQGVRPRAGWARRSHSSAGRIPPAAPSP